MHNIDEFFAKKLRDAEVEPSRRAKDLFIDKLEKRKPILFFGLTAKNWAYLGAASCLLAVSWLGFQKNENIAERDSINNINNLATKAPDKHDLALINAKPTLAAKSPISKTIKSALSHALAPIQKPINDLLTNADDRNKYAALPTESLNIENPAEVKSQTNVSEVAQVSKFEDETIVLLSPSFENAKSTVVASLNDAPVKEKMKSENTKPLVNRLLAEIIKNDKRKISRLGLLSSEMLAVKEDGFISSEGQQIREKLNWIKSKINN